MRELIILHDHRHAVEMGLQRPMPGLGNVHVWWPGLRTENLRGLVFDRVTCLNVRLPEEIRLEVQRNCCDRNGVRTLWLEPRW